MARIRKIRPGHRIAQLLCMDRPEGSEAGRQVPFREIVEMFENDPVLKPTLYKISGYINDIKKYDGGIVHVVKNGRDILYVQLMNAHQFNAENGHNEVMNPPPPPAPPEAEKPEKPAKAAKTEKTEEVTTENETQTETETGSVTAESEAESQGAGFPINTDDAITAFVPTQTDHRKGRRPIRDIAETAAA